MLQFSVDSELKNRSGIAVVWADGPGDILATVNPVATRFIIGFSVIGLRPLMKL